MVHQNPNSDPRRYPMFRILTAATLILCITAASALAGNSA